MISKYIFALPTMMGMSWMLPDQASTYAPEVDHLYLFLVGLTIFFTVLISGRDPLLFRKIPPSPKFSDSKADRRLDPSRKRLVDHSVYYFAFHFCMGSQNLSGGIHHPEGCAGCLCRG